MDVAYLGKGRDAAEDYLRRVKAGEASKEAEETVNSAEEGARAQVSADAFDSRVAHAGQNIGAGDEAKWIQAVGSAAIDVPRLSTSSNAQVRR